MLNSNYETEFLLNMQILEDELKDNYNILSFHRYHDNQSLSGASVYFGQKEIKKNRVYIACSETFTRYPLLENNSCLIVVGPIEHKPSACSIIEVNEDIRWEEIFNFVQEIFSRYLTWSQNLAYILNNGGGIYELCVSALDFFKNPLFIHDENFNVLAMPMWVVGMSEIQIDEETGNTTVPLSRIKNFSNNPEYKQTLTTHGAHLWNPSYNAHRGIYSNIWINKTHYCGRFLINELNTSLKPSDFIMVNYFVKMLTLAFERNMFKSTAAFSFEKILQQIFSGEKPINHYFFERLKMVGWKPENTYVCFKIETYGDQLNVISNKKTCSTISVILKKSFSFSSENFVYTICNLSQSGYTTTAYKEIMSEMCLSTKSLIGVSKAFNGIVNLLEGFKQAEWAIKLGKCGQKNKMFFSFSDYVLDYIIQHCMKEFSAKNLCSDAILKLNKVDKEKGTRYLQTLQYYFDNGCQQTATAQVLFIHRSTLDYRLKKIQQIAQIDLDDSTTRLYLQISMLLLPYI